MSTRAASPIKTAPMLPFTPVSNGMLQRKCACGTHTTGGGECEACSKQSQTLQRATRNSEPQTPNSDGVPPIVHEVLRSPGQPLDATTRAFFEPRFGHDFSLVRAHTDARAAESARAVGALACTVGREVVFAAGQYAPGTTAGTRMLAHELAHVEQQRGTALSRKSFSLSSSHDSAEEEADVVSEQIVAGNSPGPVATQASHALQRKMVVDKPKDNIPNPGGKGLVRTNAKTVKNYLTTLCSGGSVAVDASTGNATIDKGFCTVPALSPGVVGPPSPSPAQASKTPTGCGCICDLVNSAHLWTIKVDDSGWPQTLFDDPDAANGRKAGGSGGTVTTPSPNSPKLWGAATAGGKELDVDPWLVLGHELCGHGWLGNSGGHGPDEASLRGEGGHQLTVARENALRAEQGIDLRGTFKDPNCGESYWRDKAKPGTVNWSSYRSVCDAWRAAYNKAHGTKYKITDRIP